MLHVVTVPVSARVLQRGQLRFLRDSGFDVTVVSSPGPELQLVGAEEKVSTLPVPIEREITPWRDLVSLWRLWRLMRKVHPVITNAGTPKAGFLGALAAYLACVPCRFYTLYGLRIETVTGLKRLILSVTERIACRCSHRVVCVSESLRRRVLELGLADEQKTVVLASGSCCGIDASVFVRSEQVMLRAVEVRKRLGIPRNAPVLGFVGRLVRDKGLLELVEAWKIVTTEFPNLHILLVGPFESGDPLPVELKDALLVDSRIHLLGENWDTPPLYAAMDIFTLPTHREGFPNVILEASAMELPVVATEVTGCVDAVQNGVTGALVPPRDPTGLADAILLYLKDPELRIKHGRAGRAMVLSDFRPEPIWKELHKEYSRLLQMRGFPIPQQASDAYQKKAPQILPLSKLTQGRLSLATADIDSSKD